MDFSIAPAAILSGQPYDQVFNFRLDTWPAAFLLARIGPLMAHQFSVPFQYGFRLEEPDQINHLADRLARAGFQCRHQYGQRQLFCTSGLDRIFLFSYQEVELVLEDVTAAELIDSLAIPEQRPKYLQ